MSRYLAAPLLAAVVAACDRRPPPLPPVDVAVYRDSIQAFHARRTNAIYGPEGWATLLGLWWLKPGETRLGAAPDNHIVLLSAAAPASVGSILVEGDSARFVTAPGVRAAADRVPGTITSLRLVSDLEPNWTRLRVGSLLLQHVVRNGRPGLRVKDTLHPARFNHAPLDYFPTDTAFRIQARFVPSATPDSLDIVSVLGNVTKMSVPGALHFPFGGREHRLLVIREPEDHSPNLFVMFRDPTNGKETYPAMRYTYVTPPDSLGRTVLDFNRSYNPPCAFTPAAICPFPPRGNELPFRVTAGELKPAGHK